MPQAVNSESWRRDMRKYRMQWRLEYEGHGTLHRLAECRWRHHAHDGATASSQRPSNARDLLRIQALLHRMLMATTRCDVQPVYRIIGTTRGD